MAEGTRVSQNIGNSRGGLVSRSRGVKMVVGNPNGFDSAGEGKFRGQNQGRPGPLSNLIDRTGQRWQVRLARQSAAHALEHFFLRLPLPVLVLDWDLCPVFVNQAARETVHLWRLEPKARLLKNGHDGLKLPQEIAEACAGQKARWEAAVLEQCAVPRRFRPLVVNHPQEHFLQASVSVIPLHGPPSARPSLLVQFERIGTSEGIKGQRSRLQGMAWLTATERALVDLVCQGCSNKQVAQKLGRSVNTVKSELHHVFQKLRVESRARLILSMK